MRVTSHFSVFSFPLVRPLGAAPREEKIELTSYISTVFRIQVRESGFYIHIEYYAFLYRHSDWL